jgi:methylmalonyl-CoA/ethylmalonyl-CoA epimerase
LSVEFRFHHVGLAVHEIDQAAQALIVFDLRPDPALPDAVDPVMNVRLRFLRAGPDQPIVELVEGLRVGSPVANILARNGPMPYHLCFAVDSLPDAATRLRTRGYRPCGGPIQATGFGGKLIQFFYNVQIGLIELVELPGPV